MVRVIEKTNRDLFVRRCVACGYDGALLHGGQAGRCARCGCDLESRPARSYAEMEGLCGTLALTDAARDFERRTSRMLQRWLAFLFVVMVGFVVITSLVAASIP